MQSLDNIHSSPLISKFLTKSQSVNHCLGISGKPVQYSCLENPMNSTKRQKDMTLKDELPRSVGAQYANGDQWRNNSRENEEAEPKQKKKKTPSCGCDW